MRAVLEGETSPRERAGIGIAAPPVSLPQSWASALIALRLSSEREPVVDAADLGALLALATAADATFHETPDVAALTDLVDAHPGADHLLDAIVATDSLRTAGVDAGLHHSTVQVRAAQYSEALGFDIRTPRGRVRLSLALSLHRLATARFG